MKILLNNYLLIFASLCDLEVNRSPIHENLNCLGLARLIKIE